MMHRGPLTVNSISQTTRVKSSCGTPFCFMTAIATRYGLYGPGIESRWGARFSAPVQTGPRAHPASHTMGTGSFLRVKQPGRGVDHPPHLAPRAFVAWYRVNLMWTYRLWCCALRAMKDITDNTPRHFECDRSGCPLARNYLVRSNSIRTDREMTLLLLV